VTGTPHTLRDGEVAAPRGLPDGVAGVDGGLTLTKSVAVRDGRMSLRARATGDPAGALEAVLAARVVGVTGARPPGLRGPRAVTVPEIDAGARGVLLLMPALAAQPFVLALLGTGTAFALVRDGTATHLGGTALGGGSFAGIARRIEPSLSYEELVTRAERGERRNADLMIADAYAGGVGRIGPDLTAAHLAREGGSPDDVLAALLNLHAENIAQIAASRALVAGAPRLVLAGGFVHGNGALASGIIEMAQRFRIETCVAPEPGFAGAIGAAAVAAEQTGTQGGSE
jgi:pantothenate kinase